jgi:hypothetical protein
MAGPGPYIPSKEIAEGLEKPKSREEVREEPLFSFLFFRGIIFAFACCFWFAHRPFRSGFDFVVEPAQGSIRSIEFLESGLFTPIFSSSKSTHLEQMFTQSTPANDRSHWR